MNRNVSRRSFLSQTGCAVGIAALGGPVITQRLAFAEEPNPSSDPLAWPVGCRDAMLPTTGQSDCWAAVQAIQADVIEAVIDEEMHFTNLFHPMVQYSAADDEGIEQLADALQASQCKIAALCMANKFAARPKEEIDWCVKAANAAKTLGTPAIRIDVVPHGMERGEFLQLAIRTLSTVIERTESTGVKFAIENHGNTSNDPDFLTPLFEGVGSDRLGLTLDTANFYWFGHPLSRVYEIYEQFAPRAFHTHCKSINYPTDQEDVQRPMGWEYGKYHGPIDEGDIDFTRVLKILRDANYTGTLCVENESLRPLSGEEATSILAREIEFLRGLQEEM